VLRLNRRYANGEITGELLAKASDESEWKPHHTLLKHIKPSREFLLREELAARERLREQNVRKAKQSADELRRAKTNAANASIPQQAPRVKTEFKKTVPLVPKKTKSEIDHARVLALEGKTTRTDIKKAYRKRIAEYHPDKVAHLGVELRVLAVEKSKEINEAFAYFESKYDLSRADET
jgi:DnaJ-domain-containing protein 1